MKAHRVKWPRLPTKVTLWDCGIRTHRHIEEDEADRCYDAQYRVATELYERERTLLFDVATYLQWNDPAKAAVLRAYCASIAGVKTPAPTDSVEEEKQP